MTRQPGPGQCGEPWPQAPGVRCTRPEGHEGGHRDEVADRYWQAEGAIETLARIGSNCTSCSQKRVNCRCGARS